jgi:CRP-like cAMP-binding protein
MALEDDITILSQAPLFGLLEIDAIRLIAFAAETRALRAGEVLFHKGDRADGAYVVVRGAIALDAREDGSPATFVAEPGALIGQSALFLRNPRPATATARDASGVMRVSPTLVRRVLEEYPRAAGILHRALVTDLVSLSSGLERVRQQLLTIEDTMGAERKDASSKGI